MQRFTAFLQSHSACVRLIALATLLVVFSRHGELRPAPVGAQTPPASPRLHVGNAHLFPNPRAAARLGLGRGPAGSGSLPGGAPPQRIPYLGGPLMTSPTAYTIFWLPAGFHYEGSGAAADDARYESLVNGFFRDLNASSMFQLLTQYSTTNFPIPNRVILGGTWVDTTGYGHTGSTADPLHDADIQAAVQRALAANPGWGVGLNAEFLVYTALGVNSCYDAQNTICNFPTPQSPHGDYCAYHSFFTAGSTNAVYANMPDLTNCIQGSTLYPHNDAAADVQMSVSSHEFFESVTDPLLNGWDLITKNPDGTIQSEVEIGDQCAWLFGAHDATGANVLLHLGAAYGLQLEWSNTSNGCELQLPPTIYRIRDNQGLTTGGYRVTIDGQGMLTIAGQLGVSFGANAATNPSCSEDGCQVTVPAGGAGTVTVTVTADGLVDNLLAVSVDQFTYLPPCQTLSLSTVPATSPQTAGTRIQLMVAGVQPSNCYLPDYQFLVTRPGGSASVLQDGSGTQAIWVTTGLAAGSYQLTVRGFADPLNRSNYVQASVAFSLTAPDPGSGGGCLPNTPPNRCQ